VSAYLAADGGFTPPSTRDFDFPPVFGEGTFVTKPMLIIVLGTAVVALLLWLAARRAALVPGKMQFAGESFYGFVRNTIGIDAIGAEGRRYVPYLTALFSFIVVLNISGFVPFVQFPATSKIAIPLFLAVISWLLFIYVGIRKQGIVGYFKNMMFPPGVPWPIYILLAPLEFFSTIIVRPATLTLRLTLNMFAGHLVLLVCVLGGEYLLLDGGPLLKAISVVPFGFGIVLSLFELFIQVLQAYVFALLSALYIGGALVEEH
jgi:F-type H+-transporting ATPase subunit a